jgi:hypothetical protein
LAREVLSTGNVKRMTHLVVIVAVSLLTASATNADPFDGPAKQPNKQSKGGSKQTTLTGCVDEQDGHYVLLDQRTLNPIADLDPNGVSTEDLFAKHVGQKVTVRGSSTSGGSRPVFKVRSIETVSEMCAASAPQ